MQSWDNILLLHIFNENMAIANRVLTEQPQSVVNDRFKDLVFSDDYFIVMVVKSENEDVLRMWSLKLSSQAPIPIKDYGEQVYSIQ